MERHGSLISLSSSHTGWRASQSHHKSRFALIFTIWHEDVKTFFDSLLSSYHSSLSPYYSPSLFNFILFYLILSYSIRSYIITPCPTIPPIVSLPSPHLLPFLLLPTTILPLPYPLPHTASTRPLFFFPHLQYFHSSSLLTIKNHLLPLSSPLPWTPIHSLP